VKEILLFSLQATIMIVVVLSVSAIFPAALWLATQGQVWVGLSIAVGTLFVGLVIGASTMKWMIWSRL
jgi:hypothetical protein